MNRDTCRVNLRKAWICEVCSPLVALPSCRTVAVHGIGREEISTAVTACGNDHGVCTESLKLSCHKVSCNDTLCLAVDYDEIKHLMTRVACNGTGCDLPVEGSVCTEKELLSGLSAGIECTAYLHASERTVGKISAVFPGERNALGYALVNDGCADLCKTIDISLPCTVVATLDGVIEETVNRVIVILIVLCGIDTSLGGDGVRPSWRIADAENLDIVAEFAESGGSRSSAETGSDYDYFKFPFVVRTDKTNFRLTFGPFFSQRSVRNLRD